MAENSSRTYRFSNFTFDASRLLLYHQDNLVCDVDKKSLEVLGAIVEREGDVAEYDHIISEVWADNLHGATPARVNQYVSRLQKTLGIYEPGISFLQNIKGRGYRFTGQLEGQPVTRESAIESTGRRPEKVERRSWVWAVPAFVGVGLLFVLAGWLYKEDDAEAVQYVLRESQMFESLVMYKSPATVTDADLDRFWTPDDHGVPNSDRQLIRQRIQKLIDEGTNYGHETRNEQFDFQSIEINKNGTFATARTLEKWFITAYNKDGALIRNRTVGPYFVDYILKKIDGRWLVEKSTTATVVRPVPQLARVDFIDEPAYSKPFRARILGRDIEPSTIHLKLIGPGCPNDSPCKIPHATLLETAKLSKESIDNASFTLKRGTFELFAMNGDSKESNGIKFTVP